MLSSNRLSSVSNIVSFGESLTNGRPDDFSEYLYTQTQQNSIQAEQSQSAQIQRIEGCWGMVADDGNSSSMTSGIAIADRKRKCEAVIDLTEEEEGSVPKSQKTIDPLEKSIALTTEAHLEKIRSARSFEIRGTNNTLIPKNINVTKKAKEIFRYLCIKHQCRINKIDHMEPGITGYTKLQKIFFSKEKTLEKYVKEYAPHYGNYNLPELWTKHLPPKKEEQCFLYDVVNNKLKGNEFFTIVPDNWSDQEPQKTIRSPERPRGLIQKSDLTLVTANNSPDSIVIDIWKDVKKAMNIFKYLCIKHQCIVNGIDYREPGEGYGKLQEDFFSKKKFLKRNVREQAPLYGNYKLSDVWTRYLPPPNQEDTFLKSLTDTVKRYGSFTIYLDKLTDQESQKTSISQPGQPTTIDLSEESEDPPQITWQDDYELQLANLEVSENEHYPISIAGEVSAIQERKNTKNYRVFVQEDKNKVLTKGQFDYLVIKYLKNISDQKVETRLGVTTAFTNLILAIPQNQLEGYTLTQDWKSYIDKKIKNYDLSKKLPYDAISDKFKMALGLANF